MTIRRAPKGLWLAVTAIERVGFSRLRLYEHYDSDGWLNEALITFHLEWWSRLGRSLRRLDPCLPDLDDPERQLAELVGLREAHDYLGELAALATEAGLDRIPMVGVPPVVNFGYLPSGIAQAHCYLWHLDKALLWEASQAAGQRWPSVPRPTFVILARFGTPIAAGDTSIAGTDSQWDPRTETRADARGRLPRETDLARDTIEAELARIADEGAYQFPDTSTQRGGISRLDRDVHWVWWRIRLRWTFAQIAQEWDRIYPRDIQLQAREDDNVARECEVELAHEPWLMTTPADAVGLIRKAVTTFARRARVDVTTGPGRRPRRAQQTTRKSLAASVASVRLAGESDSANQPGAALKLKRPRDLSEG
ncbi:MAG: hypothetical protein ACHQ01_06850 [Candidatus Limnocylindrales bacterium]